MLNRVILSVSSVLDAIEKPSLFKEWLTNKPNNLKWYHFSIKDINESQVHEAHQWLIDHNHGDVKLDDSILYIVCDKYMIPLFQFVDIDPKVVIFKWNRKHSISWSNALTEGYTIQKFQRIQE